MRLRLIAEPGPSEIEPEEWELADTLRRLREEMIATIQPVSACATCGRGFPLPNGRWDGGYCCGGTTENVFSQAELASIRASGTKPGDLRIREYEQAGCAFRCPNGCILEPAHRPNLCVRYACRMLNREYDERGISSEVRRIASSIQRTFSRFETLRNRRIEHEFLDAAERAIRGRR